MQFLAYDIDVRSITGTADLKATQKYLAGTGYQPVETSNGKAVVSLFAEHLKDTSAGPYKHLIPIIYASKSGDKKVVPFSNGFSLIRPLTDPSVALVLGPTPLAGVTPNAPPPVAQRDIGVDLLGIAKYITNVKIDADKGQATISEQNAQGRETIAASFADPEPNHRYAEAHRRVERGRHVWPARGRAQRSVTRFCRLHASLLSPASFVHVLHANFSYGAAVGSAA